MTLTRREYTKLGLATTASLAISWSPQARAETGTLLAPYEL
jgi:hypothetical protein